MWVFPFSCSRIASFWIKIKFPLICHKINLSFILRDWFWRFYMITTEEAKIVPPITVIFLCTCLNFHFGILIWIKFVPVSCTFSVVFKFLLHPLFHLVRMVIVFFQLSFFYWWMCTYLVIRCCLWRYKDPSMHLVFS